MPDNTSTDTLTANKALVRAYCQTFYNEKDFDTARTMLADDFVNHHPGVGAGHEATIDSFRSQIAEPYPDFTLHISRIIAEADHVWTYSLISLDGTTPTVATVDIWRISFGKLAEHWDIAQQLPETTP